MRTEKQIEEQIILFKSKAEELISKVELLHPVDDMDEFNEVNNMIAAYRNRVTALLWALNKQL